VKKDLAIAETKLASKTSCLQRLMMRCHELQLMQQQVKHPKLMRISKRMRDPATWSELRLRVMALAGNWQYASVCNDKVGAGLTNDNENVQGGVVSPAFPHVSEARTS
jgi:hypothetical protein